MASSTRRIDELKGAKTKPMKVLLLGMCRTGTLSLYDGMRKLGYTPYHTIEAYLNPLRDFPVWEEALKAKFLGEGKPFGREEFDKLLGNYDACSDVPCVLFIDELIAAYPDAKVVLTTRDPDKWVASMNRTVFEVFSWSSWGWIAPYDPSFARPWYSFNRALAACWMGVSDEKDFRSAKTPANGEIAKQQFMEHYSHVRRVVPKVNLLEFKAEDGWIPLCEFLGHQVPEEEFPNINDAEEYVRIHKFIWWRTTAYALAKTVLPVAVALGGIYAWRVFQLGRYLPYEN